VGRSQAGRNKGLDRTTDQFGALITEHLRAPPVDQDDFPSCPVSTSPSPSESISCHSTAGVMAATQGSPAGPILGGPGGRALTHTDAGLSVPGIPAAIAASTEG
jgi:hypothetical protein